MDKRKFLNPLEIAQQKAYKQSAKMLRREHLRVSQIDSHLTPSTGIEKLVKRLNTKDRLTRLERVGSKIDVLSNRYTKTRKREN